MTSKLLIQLSRSCEPLLKGVLVPNCCGFCRDKAWKKALFYLPQKSLFYTSNF